MRSLALLVAVLSVSAAPRPQTFTGVITDSMCAGPGHASMRMGPTDADCTIACVMAHDARYVLAAAGKVYDLSDQRTPEKFAGMKVTITGELDSAASRITVASIAKAR